MEDANASTHFHLYVILIYTAILMAVFFLWYFIWLKPGYCSFPTGKYNFQRLLHDTTYRPTYFSDFCMKYGYIFFQLDPDYWIAMCGTDIYCYLFCQRQIISVCLYMLAINFGVKIYTSLFYESQDWGLFSTTVNEASLKQNLMFAQQMIMISAFTVILSVKIIRMIDHFGKVSFNYYNKMDTIELKSLQMRTLHIRGIVPEDTRAEILMEYIEEYLQRINGKMLATKIIPNYAELVKLETKRRDLSLLYRLFNVCRPQFRKLWIPSKYYDKEKNDAATSRLNAKIQRETENQFLSSGHAFICFDSVTTMYSVAKFLGRKVPKNLFSYTLGSLSTRFDRFRHEELASSTLRRSGVNSEDIRNEYEKFGVFARPATEPLDIIWGNMSGYRGIYFFRRWFINVTIIVTLFFFSSPYGIFKLISRYLIDLESYHWAYKISPGFGKFMQGGVPPFLTLGDSNHYHKFDKYSTYEKNTYHSKYQKSVFMKSAFFLIFNNVIIPGLSFTQKSSVFTATKILFQDPHMLLRNFYNYNTGGFFVTTIAQLIVLYTMVYLLRIRQLVSAFMSPWLQHYRQQYINDVEKWSKKPLEIFEYGYLLAQMIVVFFIVMIFSTTIPLILMTGIVYFILRHIVDAMNLLFMHKMELDSLGSLIRTMLSAVVMCGILFHVCFFGFLIAVKGYISMGVLAVNTAALIWLLIYLRRPFFSLIRLQKRVDPMQDADSGHIGEWQELYRHPLIIKREQEKQMGLGTQVDIILDLKKKEKQKTSKVEKLRIRPIESDNLAQSVVIELTENKQN